MLTTYRQINLFTFIYCYAYIIPHFSLRFFNYLFDKVFGRLGIWAHSSRQCCLMTFDEIETI